MSASDRPVITIEGEQVALGPLHRDLLPFLQRWMNDPVTLRAYDWLRPRSIEQLEAWYNREQEDKSVASFVIYERATWRPVGKTALYDIDLRNRKAEFGILIGEADARGRGYGTETARLMLDYAFTALGLHNVMLEAAAFNVAAIRAYHKAGFREFGRRRACYLMNGQQWDEIYMDCLSTEFTSPVLGRIFVPDQPRS